MDKAYPDIFCQWLLKELQDHHNFTLLTDKTTLVHRKHNIKIECVSVLGFKNFFKIKINDIDISDSLPTEMGEHLPNLYFAVRQVYRSFYAESDKRRRDDALNNFVFNNLINY